jgi:hypothetical protein
MKKLIGVAAAGALLVASGTVAGAEDSLNVTVGAAVSYTLDFNDPDELDGGAPILSGPRNQQLYSNYEQDESFNIDLIQLGISGQRGIVGFAAKIDLGDLAALAGDDLDGDIGLQEANLTIQALELDGYKAAVIAGRFGTPIGYEVLEPWGNSFISRARSWSWQPVNHDGVMLLNTFGSGDFATSFNVGMVNSIFVQDQGQVTAGLTSVKRANNVDDEYGVLASITQGLGNALSLSVSGIYTEEMDSAFDTADSIDLWEVNSILGGSCGNCRYALEFTYLNADPRSNSESMENPETTVWDVTGRAGYTFGRCTADVRVSWTDEDYDYYDTGILSVSVAGGIFLAEGVQLRAEYRYDYVDDTDGGLGFADDDSDFADEDDIHVLQAQLIWTPEIGG